MIISDEGNKILESNGIVIKSKKTGEWEVVSGGGGGAFATFSVEPITEDLICDKSFDELYEAIQGEPVSIALNNGEVMGNGFATLAVAKQMSGATGTKRTIKCTFLYNTSLIQVSWREGENISRTIQRIMLEE